PLGAADRCEDVSEFRVEKRRTAAALTLSTGATVCGCFFLAGSRANQVGPERVGDLLNAETGFFPFELNSCAAPHTVLYNRSQVVLVTVLGETIEPELDPGYHLATVRAVEIQRARDQAVRDQSVRTEPHDVVQERVARGAARRSRHRSRWRAARSRDR